MNAKKMLIGVFGLVLAVAAPGLSAFAELRNNEESQSAVPRSDISEKDLVDQAAGLLDTALNSSRRAKVAHALKTADGVLICPFVDQVGSAGLLMYRSRGDWKGPAFVTVDEHTASALAGNGWIIPIDRSGMEALMMRTDDDTTPETEGVKSTVSQEGFSLYRDKVGAKERIEEIVLQPAARSNAVWWGRSVFLSQALSGKPDAELGSVVKKLQELSR